MLNKNVRGKVEPAGPGDPIAANSSIPRPGITGNVIGIIDNTVIVQTRIGATVLVQLDPNTLIRRRGRPAKASEILVGEPIVAIGRVNANRGRLNAVVVAVDPPQPFRSAGAPN